MREIIKIIPMVLYFLVGVISLAMAFKSLFSKKFLPFHEHAAGKTWDRIEAPFQRVIIALIRISGLGFLVTGLLMVVFPVVNYFVPDPFVKYAVPVVAFVFCGGLFWANYHLYKETYATTPWKGSFIAMAVIAAGIIISVF
jgi:hypothetical protein